MPTMDNPNSRRFFLIERSSIKWIDDRDNWKKWEREMLFHWWMAHILVKEIQWQQSK